MRYVQYHRCLFSVPEFLKDGLLSLLFHFGIFLCVTICADGQSTLSLTKMPLVYLCDQTNKMKADNSGTKRLMFSELPLFPFK